MSSWSVHPYDPIWRRHYLRNMVFPPLRLASPKLGEFPPRWSLSLLWLTPGVHKQGSGLERKIGVAKWIIFIWTWRSPNLKQFAATETHHKFIHVHRRRQWSQKSQRIRTTSDVDWWHNTMTLSAVAYECAVSSTQQSAMRKSKGHPEVRYGSREMLWMPCIAQAQWNTFLVLLVVNMVTKR